MGHELYEFADGRASIAVTGETPWHRLGQRVDASTPIPDGLGVAGLSGLDYRVSDDPVMVSVDGGTVTVPGAHAVTYRSPDGVGRRALAGTVGPNFGLVQPERMADFGELLRQYFETSGYTVGAVRNFSRLFLYLERPNRGIATPSGIDDYRSGIAIMDAYDGSQSLTVCASDTRIVCNNTFSLAMRGVQNAWRVRHTSGFATQVDNLERTLTRYHEQFDSLLAGLCDADASIGDADECFRRLVPPRLLTRDEVSTGRRVGEPSGRWERAHEDAMSRVRREMATCGRNRYAVFQGLTGWAEHGRAIRGDRAEAALPGGSTQRSNQTILDLLTV